MGEKIDVLKIGVKAAVKFEVKNLLRFFSSSIDKKPFFSSAYL
jgi:hypothetical protein